MGDIVFPEEKGIIVRSSVKETAVRSILIVPNAVEILRNHPRIVCLLVNEWGVQKFGFRKIIKKNNVLCLFRSQ